MLEGGVAWQWDRGGCWGDGMVSLSTLGHPGKSKSNRVDVTQAHMAGSGVWKQSAVREQMTYCPEESVPGKDHRDMRQ